MTGLLKPGWYRHDGRTLVWVAPPDTPLEEVPGDRLHLVLVQYQAEEVPLW